LDTVKLLFSGLSPKTIHVVIIDDDGRFRNGIQEPLSEYLKKRGYSPVYHTASNMDEVWAMRKSLERQKINPDLIFMDELIPMEHNEKVFNAVQGLTFPQNIINTSNLNAGGGAQKEEWISFYNTQIEQAFSFLETVPGFHSGKHKNKFLGYLDGLFPELAQA
jgi:chemotaxis response regulator CheB